jgi:DNA (cytosine-5)-methyltransferase 3A
MRVLSLFDGISVAQQALKELGIEPEYFASEIDKYALQVTAKNFPDTKQGGSVTDLYFSENNFLIGSFDLLIGGSPCQDLSIAKKNREGLSGSRSGLFWHYVRILNEVKPKYFVLENVNSMPKEAKQTITEALGVEPVMINAALVSAQNRKRLFWVGKLVGDKYEQVIIPQPEDKGMLLRDILQLPEEIDEKFFISYNYDTNRYFKDDTERKARTIRTSGRGSGIDDKHNWDTIRIGQIGKGGQGDRIYSPDGKSVNLSANGGGRGAKTGLYAVASRTYPRYKQDGVERSKQIEVRKDEKSNALTSVTGDSMVMDDCVIRKLTPVECERLQSLPDEFTSGISNSQRYKCLGNAFNCAVIKHILKFIVK